MNTKDEVPLGSYMAANIASCSQWKISYGWLAPIMVERERRHKKNMSGWWWCLRNAIRLAEAETLACAAHWRHSQRPDVLSGAHCDVDHKPGERKQIRSGGQGLTESSKSRLAEALATFISVDNARS